VACSDRSQRGPRFYWLSDRRPRCWHPILIFCTRCWRYQRRWPRRHHHRRKQACCRCWLCSCCVWDERCAFCTEVTLSLVCNVIPLVNPADHMHTCIQITVLSAATTRTPMSVLYVAMGSITMELFACPFQIQHRRKQGEVLLLSSNLMVCRVFAFFGFCFGA